MQIRFKITITYAITVAVILLLLCCSIYFFSAQNRVAQFRERLKARGMTAYSLLRTERIDPDLVRKVSQFSASALFQKSISIYDDRGRMLFSDHDDNTDPLKLTPATLASVKAGKDLYFTVDNRDAVAFRIAGNVVAIAALDDDRVEWLEKLRLVLVASFFVSIGLVVLIGYIFSLGLVHSISSIADKVNHISSRDLSLRLESGMNRDELDKLAQTINSLLQRLQHSFETQSRFIDNASHELSTPLAVVLSQLDIARQKERSKEEYQQLVDSVYEDVSRLDVLVKSLLDLAKISGSARGLELFSFRIDDLLMQLPLDIRKINPAYKVQMIFDEFPENEEGMRIYGNEALLRCAFQNIVHNACKYAPDHTAIVKLEFADESIRVSVQDYGPGIDEADMEHIFQPFYRSINVNSNIPGTGLGLSLARNIIKLHNGDITVDTSHGVGTVFTVSLPQESFVLAEKAEA